MNCSCAEGTGCRAPHHGRKSPSATRRGASSCCCGEAHPASGFDAILVLSFGGPEGPEDVRPFLENVTRGRGVPADRLDVVEQQYLHFGGVSPINALNLDIIARLKKVMAAEGHELPVFWGNRNWNPTIEEAAAQMRQAGVRRALVFPTSPWAGYSGCRQYDEDIQRALSSLGPEPGMELVKIRQYYDHPLLIASVADAVRAAKASLPQELREQAKLVFTAHSVPAVADRAAGPKSAGGHLYSRQIAEAARLVAAQLGGPAYDIAYQSRSGPPSMPWLEPDISDRIEELAAAGVRAVVVGPIGFISDHMEVVWDLDTLAQHTADRVGVAMARSSTPGTDPRFTEMVAELIAEQTSGAAPRRLGAEPLLGATANGAPCAADCCVSARPPHPTGAAR